MYYSVDVYRDDMTFTPAIMDVEFDAALFHIQAAASMTDLDVESLQLIVYDSDDDPLWRVKLIPIEEEAELIDLEARRRERNESD